jgi:hypothetical protein
MTKLSDNRVGDRLHAALEMIGTEEGETVRGNTALIAARQSLSLLLKQGLLIAAERNSDHVVMNQPVVPPSKDLMALVPVISAHNQVHERQPAGASGP